jgi:deoxyadenosine/deoxycytidine kinase
MGTLITVVGNSGVGKTTLTQQLCRQGTFTTGLEQHAERPFQKLFAQDLSRYAFTNQVDYLLLRAEQEQAIRQSPGIGLQDGGLEQDFYVFTRHFYNIGYLGEPEFQLCQRLYTLLRLALPPPDLIIYLQAPLDVIARRYERRGRKLEIARLADLGELQALLDGWLTRVQDIPVLRVDASADDPSFSKETRQVIEAINQIQRLPISPENEPTA